MHACTLSFAHSPLHCFAVLIVLRYLVLAGLMVIGATTLPAVIPAYRRSKGLDTYILDHDVDKNPVSKHTCCTHTRTLSHTLSRACILCLHLGDACCIFV